MKKTILSITAALFTLFLLFLAHLSCGGGGDTPPPPVAVTGLTLNRNLMTLAVGDATGTLIPATSPQNAANKNVTWSSSDNAVATVNANGVVTPNSVGTATITATTQNGGKTANCLIKVVDSPIPAERVYLSRNELSITVGGSGSLALNFIPSIATDQNVTWESSNTAVATVDARNGFVTARAEGEATITAKYNQQGGAGTISGPIYDINDSKVLAPPPAAISATVKVGSRSKLVPATGIKVGEDQQYIELSVDGSGLLLPTVLPANATNRNVSFSSSAPNIVSVSSLGLMTGRAVGGAVISATTEDGGYTDTCVVRVVSVKVDPAGVSLDKETIWLGDIGKTEQLAATVSPSNATDKSLYWYSSDESVAAVDMNGTVQAKGNGTAIVTAKTQVGGHTANCRVTVTETSVPVTGVTLNKTSATVSIGGTETLIATVLPSDATNKSVTWTSNNNAIATVSNGTVTGVAAGDAVITATTQDGSKTAACAVTVTNAVSVTGVTLNKTSASIVVGGAETLTATIAPASATNKNVTWVSSDPSIATVSPSTPTTSGGTVTGVKAGTATITVTTEDGSKTATCAVTVANNVAVTGVTLDKTSATILVGNTEILTATIAPADATNKAVTWASSNNAIATVSNGTVRGVAVGSATITVTTQDGSKTATCAVTVTDTSVPVTGLTVSPTSADISVGGTIHLTATVQPSAASQNVTWASSNNAIATVSNGTVTGVAKGDAVITATTQDGSKMATCAVTVTDTKYEVSGVTLNKMSASIVVGGTEPLTATIAPANATNKNVTWKSSNTAVATVSNNGTVTGVAAGSATIIVATQDNGKTATCAVTVNVPVASVSLKKTTNISVNGGTETLTATILPATATNKNVTWVSSAPSIASVSPSTPTTSGVTVTGGVAGTAIITATTEDGGKTDTCTVTVEEIPVKDVTLDSTSISVPRGDTKILTATILPATATNQKVTWVSSDTTVASVSPSTPTTSGGTVTGVKAGTAAIIVLTEDGGHTKICTVTVVEPVTGVTVAPATATVNVGAKETLTATVAPSTATNKNVTWGSSDTSVATVSGSGLAITVTGVKAGTATITATTQDGSKTAPCIVTVPVPVASVSLNKTKTNIIPVGEETLVATVLPADADNKTVTWSSDKTSVATVDTNGKVTGVAAGTATITVKTTDGNKTATCTVTVTSTNVPVTSVALSPKPATVSVHGMITLTATVAPNTATNQNVTWGSSDSTIATVGVNDGKVTGVQAGTAIITVTTADGGKTDTCTVTVNNVPVTGVTLKTSTTIRAGAGNTETLTATVAPSNATNQNVTWVSSDPSIATVSPSTPTTSGGTVTGIKAGTATIIALTQDGGFMKTCTVTVVEPVTGVTMAPTTADVSVGGTILLTATVAPNTANQNVTWETSDANIAKVSGGTVTGVKVGTATITATAQGDSNQKGTCTVTVKNDVFPVTGVTVDSATATINVGGTEILTATVAPSHATNKKVTWFSSNDAIATVNNGTVKGIGPGTATIIVLTEDGGKKAECAVTVKVPVTGVSLNKTSTTVSLNGTETLTATVAPSNATNKNVTWVSNASTVATVNPSGTPTLSGVTVTGVGVAGTAVITATTQDGSQTATCVVTVADTNIPVTGVSLNKTSTIIHVGVGNAETLTATVAPTNATNKGVNWFSSDPAIATVGVNDGKVTGLKAGSTTITVVTLDGGKTATCTVTVIDP